MSTWDFDVAICELRLELRSEIQEEVRRSKPPDSGLLDWSYIWPMLVPVVAAWLTVLVLLADRT